MRSSKDRTIEKKRRSKAIGAKRTEQSRARRISNKHKRQEIHDIDPSLKVFIMNEKIYDVHGVEIEVIDGKVKPVLINGVYKLAEEKTDEMTKKYGKTFNIQNPAGGLDADNVIDKIKTKNKSALERLTDRFKNKKIEL